MPLSGVGLAIIRVEAGGADFGLEKLSPWAAGIR